LKTERSEAARELDDFASDTQLLRLLDPENTGVTLHTMTRAATALGLREKIDLVEE
jgi:hypothetical protein